MLDALLGKTTSQKDSKRGRKAKDKAGSWKNSCARAEFGFSVATNALLLCCKLYALFCVVYATCYDTHALLYAANAVFHVAHALLSVVHAVCHDSYALLTV